LSDAKSLTNPSQRSSVRVDPTHFETALLASRLANTQTLSALATRVEQLQKKIADSALYTVALVKPPVLAA
jgi:hypothetical protein